MTAKEIAGRRGAGTLAHGDRGTHWLGDTGLAVALLAATLAAYQPAWRGGMLWDDDGHITKPELRSAGALWRIWFQPGSTQQFYPLTHSAFWVQHKLWGDNTLGYHLVNIVLHAASAFLLALILGRLRIPGACLAAALFALHPVHVESVAWITELKNVLSGVLYLGAALTYLHFDESRRKTHYAAALALFVLALLSKTVTATLPAAVLVVFWWQRGQLGWQRDIRPLVPFFLFGLTAGLFTAWVERTFIGAEGSEFAFTVIERCLIAGRAICFYLGKLVWPTDLIFIYPRWEINQTVWWQYLYPLAVLGLLLALWLLRNRWRAPLAAILFFSGTLFPVLGFLNVYPFRYSFVADHFQYLASLGIISMIAAGVTGLIARRRVDPGPATIASGLLLAGLLGVLSWRQCRQYVDVETLYRETTVRNPDCWLAQINWGNVLRDQGRTEEAVVHYHEALRIKPDYPEADNNLGNVLRDQGRMEEAVAHYQKALRIKPDYVEAHNNWGIALLGQGRIEEAVKHYQEALRLKPKYADAHNNWGIALQALGRIQEAITHYQEALRIKPSYAEAQFNWGTALQSLGRMEEAAAHYHEALRIKANYPEAQNNWGIAMQSLGRLEEAIAHYREALRIKPDYAQAHNNWGIALQRLGRIEEAMAHYQQALRIKPNYAQAHNNWGMALNQRGRPQDAVEHFHQALRLKPDFTAARDNLQRAQALLQQKNESAKH